MSATAAAARAVLTACGARQQHQREHAAHQLAKCEPAGQKLFDFLTSLYFSQGGSVIVGANLNLLAMLPSGSERALRMALYCCTSAPSAVAPPHWCPHCLCPPDTPQPRAGAPPVNKTTLRVLSPDLDSGGLLIPLSFAIPKKFLPHIRRDVLNQDTPRTVYDTLSFAACSPSAGTGCSPRPPRRRSGWTSRRRSSTRSWAPRPRSRACAACRSPPYPRGHASTARGQESR